MELEQVVRYRNEKNFPLIIGANTSGQHFCWGIKDCSQGGFSISEQVGNTDFDVANQRNEPTFCLVEKKAVIEVTFMTRLTLHEINNWYVVSDDSVLV